MFVYVQDEIELKTKPEGIQVVNGGEERMRMVKSIFQMDVNLDVGYLVKLGWGNLYRVLLN